MSSSKNNLCLAKVALLESRMGAELSSLVRKHGGVPVCVAAVAERPADASEQVAAFIDRLISDDVDTVVLQTGVSVNELERVASSMGRCSDLLRGLQQATKVCRGPKPVAALRKLGLDADVLVPEPHTTADMISTLAGMPLQRLGVAVVHHGERNPLLVETLEQRSRAVHEIYLYQWELPEDSAPLRHLADDLIHGVYDAVAFTSQVQVRHLFLVAGRAGCEKELVDVLRRDVVTAAVGPTCAAALEAYGVIPDVVPEHPKMGHMTLALADYMSARVRVGDPLPAQVAN